MQISSNSPSMDDWQVVVAGRSAPALCAYRNSLCRISSKNSSGVFVNKPLLSSKHIFLKPHLQILRLTRGSVYPACTGNL